MSRTPALRSEWYKAGKLYACIDCVMKRENDETEGLDDERIAELWSQLSRWQDATAHWDSETGKGIVDFSTIPCGACGSTLAGSRHRYQLWEDPIRMMAPS